MGALLFFPLKHVHFTVRKARMPITPHLSKKKSDICRRWVVAWSSVQWNPGMGAAHGAA